MNQDRTRPTLAEQAEGLPRYHSLEETSRLAGVSRTTIKNLLSEGKFPNPVVGIGSHVTYNGWDRHDVQRWRVNRNDVASHDTVIYWSKEDVQQAWGIGNNAAHYQPKGIWPTPLVVIGTTKGGVIRYGYDKTETLEIGRANGLVDEDGNPTVRRRRRT